MTKPLRISQVSLRDVGGGAEQFASLLHARYRAEGHDATLHVGQRRGAAPAVVTLPNDAMRNPWSRFWAARARSLARSDEGPVARRARRLCQVVGRPVKYARRALGWEDFHQPATAGLAGHGADRPDVLHLHGLHGDYFDLRRLPTLSRAVPTFVTLHDMWLLTGQCHHALDCERWRDACGACPHLGLAPWIKRDRTAANRSEKAAILAGCRLHVTAPSRWLLARAEASILAPGIVEARVIRNGIDLDTFRPGDRAAARAALGVPPDVPMVLAAGTDLPNHPYRDFATLRDAVARTAEDLTGPAPLLLVIGGAAGEERIGRATMRGVPFVRDRGDVARHYQAADVFVHATRADTFPTVVLEAMACGRPVIASGVGGVPEQIDDGRTGWLVPPGDVAALAARLATVLDDRDDAGSGAQAVAQRAAATTRDRCDIRRQARSYLAWFEEVTRL